MLYVWYCAKVRDHLLVICYPGKIAIKFFIKYTPLKMLVLQGFFHKANDSIKNHEHSKNPLHDSRVLRSTQKGSSIVTMSSL